MKKIEIFASIEELPAIIENLSKLEHLDLRGNQLKTLPNIFDKLVSLELISFSQNKIIELPETLLEAYDKDIRLILWSHGQTSSEIEMPDIVLGQEVTLENILPKYVLQAKIGRTPYLPDGEGWLSIKEVGQSISEERRYRGEDIFSGEIDLNTLFDQAGEYEVQFDSSGFTQATKLTYSGCNYMYNIKVLENNT